MERRAVYGSASTLDSDWLPHHGAAANDFLGVSLLLNAQVKHLNMDVCVCDVCVSTPVSTYVDISEDYAP